jgi:hypothetical protein
MGGVAEAAEEEAGEAIEAAVRAGGVLFVEVVGVSSLEFCCRCDGVDSFDRFVLGAPPSAFDFCCLCLVALPALASLSPPKRVGIAQGINTSCVRTVSASENFFTFRFFI